MRQINLHQDYSLICEWWSAYGKAPLPRHLLPTTGLIIEEKCAGFIYTTNSGLYFIEGFIASPHCTGPERRASLKTLGAGLLSFAQDLGASSIFAATSNENVIQLGSDFGFTTAPEPLTFIYKELE